MDHLNSLLATEALKLESQRLCLPIVGKLVVSACLHGLCLFLLGLIMVLECFLSAFYDFLCVLS
ncbi:unnamed protein product [Brassica rapa subsp. narinosa]